MKKFIMAIVCLMTMIVSVNAEDNIYGEWKCNSVDDYTTEETIYFNFTRQGIKITCKGIETFLAKEKYFDSSYTISFRLDDVFGVGKIDVNVYKEFFTNDLVVLKISCNEFRLCSKYKLIRVK